MTTWLRSFSPKPLKEGDNLQKFECSFENNIKIYVNGMGWKSVVRIQLAQDMDKWWALVNTVMKVSGVFLTT
jgi:hypothetical protein